MTCEEKPGGQLQPPVAGLTCKQVKLGQGPVLKSPPPTEPAAPVAPVDPAGPWAPVAPEAPVAPVAPAGP